MRMLRQRSVLLETDDLEGLSFQVELAVQLVKLLHHRVVDDHGFRQVDDHVLFCLSARPSICRLNGIQLEKTADSRTAMTQVPLFR